MPTRQGRCNRGSPEPRPSQSTGRTSRAAPVAGTVAYIGRRACHPRMWTVCAYALRPARRRRFDHLDRPCAPVRGSRPRLRRHPNATNATNTALIVSAGYAKLTNTNAASQVGINAPTATIVRPATSRITGTLRRRTRHVRSGTDRRTARTGPRSMQTGSAWLRAADNPSRCTPQRRGGSNRTRCRPRFAGRAPHNDDAGHAGRGRTR